MLTTEERGKEGNVYSDAEQDCISLHCKYSKSYLYLNGKDLGKFACA